MKIWSELHGKTMRKKVLLLELIMGSKHIKDFREKFLEKGLTPLEEIIDAKHKVECQDSEGYKYLLSYHGAVANKKTSSFNRWNKNNPFKPHNMRLYASRVQENVKILSTDEELREATNKKVKFICPNCGEPYEKKWCHWIGQADNQHFCPKCNYKIQGESMLLTYDQIKERFAKLDLILLSQYKDYKDNHSKLLCEDADGYRYYINVIEITSGNFKKYNKFSVTNPNTKHNLQLWCNLNGVNVEVIEANERRNKLSTFKCGCGNIFQTTLNSFMQGKRRCNKCVALDSKYSLLTKKWLESNNIEYAQEYRFDDCRDKKPLPFDYKIGWNGKVILIEVDGGQHYYRTQWQSEEEFKVLQNHDTIKNKYCEDNGYILVRIPYWLYSGETYKNILHKTFFG